MIVVLVCIGNIAWGCYVDKICAIAANMATEHLADKYEAEMQLLEVEYCPQFERPHWVMLTFCPTDNHNLLFHVFVFQQRLGETNLFLPEEKRDEIGYRYADDYLHKKVCYEMTQRYREYASSNASNGTSISFQYTSSAAPLGMLAKSSIDETMPVDELEKNVYYVIRVEQLNSSSNYVDFWNLLHWVFQNGYTPESFHFTTHEPNKKLLIIEYDVLNAMTNYSEFQSYIEEALR